MNCHDVSPIPHLSGMHNAQERHNDKGLEVKVDSSRKLTGTTAQLRWSQPPLGEALEDAALGARGPVSHSERRRRWDQEHSALDHLTRQLQHDDDVRRFRMAVDAIRGSALRENNGLVD